MSMARPLRIEYPQAWYPVVNRGRRGKDIFSDDQDYTLFTDHLKETSGIWNVRIAAYCLMPNHSIAKKWDWLHKNYILSLWNWQR